MHFFHQYGKQSADMNIELVREYCLKKKACNESFPFDETTLVFKVVDRIFAVTSLDYPNQICLKCDPDYAIELRDSYTGIIGAPHFNKKHWNQVSFGTDVPDSLILRLIDHSYEAVIKKFTRKQKTYYDKLP